MNKVVLVLFFVISAIYSSAQPTVLGTQLVNGGYTTYNLIDRGGARFVQLQSSSGASSGTRNWEFATGTAASTNYSTNWRPYTVGQTLSGYNAVIDPSVESASARYNTSSGGESGLLPAVVSGNYYTVNIEENASGNNFMAILETSYSPTTISSVSQSPTNVYIGQDVIVTITMATTLGGSGDESLYIRYSTDGFSTSTIAQASFSSGTDYIVTIPGSVHAAGTTVEYYILTSTDNAGTPTHSVVDFLTLNLRNSVGQNVAGANFSYAVTDAYITTSTGGNWSSTGTWEGGVVPPSGANVVVASGATLTLDGARTVTNCTVNSGGTLNLGSNTLTISSGGVLTNNGTFNPQTSTVDFDGAGTVSGTLSFNNVEISGGVDFGSNTTLNGNLTIQSGGFVNINPAIYGSSSTLTYNTGGSYNVSTEWTAGSSSGSGVPQNVTIGSGTDISFSGSTTFEANGDLVINGTMALSSTLSGDILLRGDFTNNGTFNGNERAVIFDGSSNQNIGGSSSTTFDYLLHSNSAGLTLLASIVVDNELNLNYNSDGGSITLGSNTLSSSTNTGFTISNFGQSNYIVTNGSGVFEQRNVGTGSGGRTGLIDFPIGTTSQYAPVRLRYLESATDDYGIRVCDGVYADGSCSGTELTNRSIDHTWLVSFSNTANFDLEYYWNTSEESSSFTRTNSAINYYDGGWAGLESFDAASDGSSYAGSGYYFQDGNYSETGSSPISFGISSGGLLPVHWLDVTAEAQGQKVLVQWEVEEFPGTAYYQVERSTDGSQFESLGELSAQGDGPRQLSYAYTDQPGSGQFIYRIASYDWDGGVMYSPAAGVDVKTANISITPNPASSRVGISLGNHSMEPSLVEILDATGRVVNHQKVDSDGWLIQLPAGIYFVKVNARIVQRLVVTD